MSEDYVYVLRCCAPDMTSYDGFRWPESGPVEAMDWDPKPKCGFGLHGWLWGEGDASVSAYVDDLDARWLVVRVDAGSVVDLGGKVKFPGGEVVFCGDRPAAAAEIIRLGARGAVIGAVVTAGNYGTASAGYRGTATAGGYGTATAGNYGTATVVYRGTATVGDYGTATAGERGTAAAGEYGTATAGDRGTASAGYRGTATAGGGGEIRIRWWDGSQYRTAIGYVGEDGIEADVPYVVRDGRLVKKEDGDA